MCWHHVEQRSVIKFCVGLGKSPVDTLKLIRNSETKNPCSVSVVYKWHERFRNGRKSTEDDLRDGRPCVVKMTIKYKMKDIWAPSSEFVSSSIPWWQILTAHAQPFRGERDLAFCLKVPLDSMLIWASSGGSGETACMRRLAWTFAARIGDKYQIRLTRSILFTPISKSLIKLDVLKQQSSNFTKMTSGRYFSISSFRNVFTVSQTVLVKLIVIANCKDF